MTSSLTLLDFLKPRRNEAALRLRNRLLALGVLTIRHHKPLFRLSITAVVTYLIWNAVIPEPTPSKLRSGDGNEAEVEFLWWTISLVGAYSGIKWEYSLRSRAEATFRPAS